MTLREHLEAILDQHRTVINGIGVECGCGEGCANPWPCPDYRDAVAALAILDTTDTETWDEDSPASPVCTPQRYRLVPDPEPTPQPSLEGIV